MTQGSWPGGPAPDPRWGAPDQPDEPRFATPDHGGWAQPPATTAWGNPGGVPAGPSPAPEGDAPGAPAVPPVPTPAPPSGAAPAPLGQSPYGARRAEQPAPAQGAYGQFTFPVITKQPLEPLAVAGVATAVLGLPGVVLGLLARPRVRRLRRRSMGLAWAGIALGALFTVAWTLTAVTLALNGTIDRALERPVAGDVTEPRNVAAANLAVGNCILTLPPSTSVGEVRLVPCAEPHIAQVVSTHELSGDHPGPEALGEDALARCTADVAALDPGDLALAPWYLAPSEEGWSQGNTTVVCLAKGDRGPYEGDLVNG